MMRRENKKGIQKMDKKYSHMERNEHMIQSRT